MKTYFFDLDGTLANSRDGLFMSFRAALQALGRSDIADRELARFLGTPLPEMFRTLKPGIRKSEIERGIEAFRTVYERDGIHHNHLYDGVVTFLREISHSGGRSWIVTSKPQPHAELVVESLDLKPYVRGVIGADLDEGNTKTELVRVALRISGAESEEVVMLGDRHYDIEGALENHIHPIGALWGYGSEAELRAAGCRDFAQTPKDFLKNYVQSGGGSSNRQSLARRIAAIT